MGLEVKDGQTAPSEDELKAHCKATLPRYMCPGKSPADAPRSETGGSCSAKDG